MTSTAVPSSQSLPLPPPLGYPVPDADHAVSVQLPRWQDMCDFALGEHRIKSVQQSGYPRSFIQIPIKKVFLLVVEKFGCVGETCLMYPSQRSAIACAQFLHTEGQGPSLDCVRVKPIVFNSNCPNPDNGAQLCLWATFFPSHLIQHGLTFWRLTGLGISSRVATHCLSILQSPAADLTNSANSLTLESVNTIDTVAHKQVRERIAQLIERSPKNSHRSCSTSADDVYLYQTGMSAIYEIHRVLLKRQQSPTVVFGFPYELTLKMIETYGPGCKFFGFGTSAELLQFETYLGDEARHGRQIQAVWCECASNPLLRTVDLQKVKLLAQKYDFPVIVDDTIGSFANVDVLDVSDVVITSLTKSFSGYCDVMGGSIVLNANSRFYNTLKTLIDADYSNDLFREDAHRLEINSRDYLTRSTRINSTTAYLVDHLQARAQFSCSKSGTSPSLPLRKVYYPKTCWSRTNYEARMRPATPSYTPGYGGLFTLEFHDINTAQTFFDVLQIHKGPSLGANVSLAQPYVQTVFQQEKLWAAQYGLQESIVRISVGLEDPEALLETFMSALDKAEEVLNGASSESSSVGLVAAAAAAAAAVKNLKLKL